MLTECLCQYRGRRNTLGHTASNIQHARQSTSQRTSLILAYISRRTGPFTMLLDYDNSRLQPQHSSDKRQTRFTDITIEGEVALGARVHEIHAPRGTVVLFETSSVHRGQPLKSGTRSSLTTYYQNTLRSCGEPKPPRGKARLKNPRL